MSGGFLGIGTGRCGTYSLAQILGVQHGYRFVEWHESRENRPKLQETIEHLTNGGGTVWHPILPWVDLIRREVPDLKIICLHRGQAAVVRSFVRVHKAKGDPVGFPTRDQQDYFPAHWTYVRPEAYWAEYWSAYENAMNALPREVTFHLQTSELNEDDRLKELIAWLGRDRAIPTRRHWDKNEQVLQRWSATHTDEARPTHPQHPGPMEAR